MSLKVETLWQGMKAQNTLFEERENVALITHLHSYTDQVERNLRTTDGFPGNKRSMTQNSAQM